MLTQTETPAVAPELTSEERLNYQDPAYGAVWAWEATRSFLTPIQHGDAPGRLTGRQFATIADALAYGKSRRGAADFHDFTITTLRHQWIFFGGELNRAIDQI